MREIRDLGEENYTKSTFAYGRGKSRERIYGEGEEEEDIPPLRRNGPGLNRCLNAFVHFAQ